MHAILVTGGAGYIGSHAVRALCARGRPVVVYDSLVTGHRAAVPPEVPFVLGDVRDEARLTDTLREHRVGAVLHFAALSLVGESFAREAEYLDVNAGGTATLLRAMAAAAVPRVVLSSSAATYGIPEQMPIDEDTPQRPINPYGESKRRAEGAVREGIARIPGGAAALLRYFNVAGAAEDGAIGEDHHPETHLVPNAIFAALGQRPAMTLNGTDFPTPDGTCVRDYVHVEDLAEAHLAVLDALRDGEVRTYDVGSGRGASVREVLDAVSRAVGFEVPVVLGPRREGDPPSLVTSGRRFREEIGHPLGRSTLDRIVASALAWHRAHPKGYDDRGGSTP